MMNFKKLITIIGLIPVIATSIKLKPVVAEIKSEELLEQEYLIWRVDPYPGSIYSVYILGSYHIGKNCELRSPAYEHAFRDAEKVVFEVESLNDPLLKPRIQSWMINLIQTEGIPENSEDSLRGILDEETYKMLEQKVNIENVSLDSLARFKPWVFLLMQQSYLMNQSEYDFNCGLDSLIAEQAKTKDKPILGLETIEYNLELFTELFLSVESEETIEYLNQFARAEEGELEEVNNEINKLLNSITGSIDRGELTKIENLIDDDCRNDPESCQSLLIDRNYNWIPIIEEYLTLKEDKLIVVGAGHLVGEEGVINLLEEKGYRVRRFRNSDIGKRL